MTTTQPTVSKTTSVAADELIAVTGEKSIARQWDLADALLQASPTIQSYELEKVRQAAVDKAGHEEFWQVARLRQMARTADAWPAAERIADVALDTHLEAIRAKGTIAEAKQVIIDAGKTSKVRGKPSIREIRTAVGANGTAAAPPRVDKADGGELFRRLIGRKKELREYLRKSLRNHEKEIIEFAALFAEYEAKAKALLPKNQPAPKADSSQAPSVKAERKQRVKGL